MKTCSKCGETKPLEEFNKKRDSYGAWCKICNAAYLREHYQNNKQYYADKSEKLKREKRQWIYDYLKNHPCECGEDRVACLQFDHRDRDTKEFGIAQAINSKSWKKVLEEIEKCDVRCANCHAVRTSEQFGWYATLNV